jgi:integrase/recombinase XerC
VVEQSFEEVPVLRVDHVDGTFVLMADCVSRGADVELVNRFLAHLGTRNFSTATRRAYGYDLLNFLRFLDGRGATLATVRPTDLFDYLHWRGQPKWCPT